MGCYSRLGARLDWAEAASVFVKLCFRSFFFFVFTNFRSNAATVHELFIEQ